MGRPWLFDLSAILYGIMTAQQTWWSSCARLVNYLPPSAPSAVLRVLDLGCGPGVSTIAIAQAAPVPTVVLGLDLAPRMLEQAKGYVARAGLDRRVGYVLADAGQLPIANGAVDMVTGHSFFYLVPRRERVAAEAYRVLCQGGRIATMEPRAGPIDWRSFLRHWREIRYVISVLLWRPYSGWHGRFSPDVFQDLLGGAGFSGIETETVLDGFGIIGAGERA